MHNRKKKQTKEEKQETQVTKINDGDSKSEKSYTNIFIFLSIIFLIIVQILFSIPAPCKWLEAVWEAGDLLTYVGTISLGIIAYKQNEKANKTNDKLAKLTKQANELNISFNEQNSMYSIRPVIIINRLNTWYNGDLISAMISKVIDKNKSKDEDNSMIPIEQNQIKYHQEEVKGFYFNIEENKLSFAHTLRNEQLNNIENTKYVEENNNGVSLKRNKVLYMPFQILSVGNGPAVNMSIRLYKKDYFENDSFDISSIAISLKNNVGYDLGIYIEDYKNCISTYILRIEYYDIFNKFFYYQEHELNIDEHGATFNLDVNIKYKKIKNND